MTNFREKLQPYRCYDNGVEEISILKDAPLVDCILQNREELILLCEFIEKKSIRSYLEIGVWTGKLITALNDIFQFEKIAACDMLEASKKFELNVSIPKNVMFFEGNSHSEAYITWRQEIGSFDLVMIDGDHSLAAVQKDFEINKNLPHKYLAFHDICGSNKWTKDVKEFWDGLTGDKTEIIRPNLECMSSSMGIGILANK